ncbi:MAG: hypothetical protein LUG16_07560 [Candidatus Gastranaerophilales bacterium]|nr:hypothetical protein [Candidatus Gastranaerophilales bacterium]
MEGISNVNAINSANQIYEAQEAKAYQPKVDLSDPVDNVEFSHKETAPKKSGVGKKLGTAFTSVLYPGLGQLVNGDTKSAAKHFFGAIGADAAILGGVVLAGVCPPAGIALALAGTVGDIGIRLHSIVDAYKDA